MELAGITSASTAFAAGLTTSLHCVGMCGPLACALTPGRGDSTDPLALATTYQISRVGGYTLLGLCLGAFGHSVFSVVGDAPSRVGPWLFAAFFLLVAFRLDKHLPRFAWLTRLQWRLQQTLRGRSRLGTAAAMGFATPLLPCGPLYFVFTIAAFSGSALRGAELMLSFALGTLPLLWFAQANYGWIRERLSPRTLSRLQTTVALAAAVVLVWRMRASFGFDAPGLSSLICGAHP